VAIHIGTLQQRLKDNGDQLLTTGELSRETGIPENTLTNWRSNGGAGPPYAKLAGSVYYSVAAFLTWIRERSRAKDKPTAKPTGAQRKLVGLVAGGVNWRPSGFTPTQRGVPVQGPLTREQADYLVSIGYAKWETQAEADERVRVDHLLLGMGPAPAPDPRSDPFAWAKGVPGGQPLSSLSPPLRGGLLSRTLFHGDFSE
jgi:hypothetical protein